MKERLVMWWCFWVGVSFSSNSGAPAHSSCTTQGAVEAHLEQFQKSGSDSRSGFGGGRDGRRKVVVA